jgi:hypothetical protein
LKNESEDLHQEKEHLLNDVRMLKKVLREYEGKYHELGHLCYIQDPQLGQCFNEIGLCPESKIDC